VELKVDFHVLFMIDRKFTSRQEMQAWMCAEMEKLGFVFMVVSPAMRVTIKNLFLWWAIREVENIGSNSTRNGSHNNYKCKAYELSIE
jgi:hypothetical protein